MSGAFVFPPVTDPSESFCRRVRRLIGFLSLHSPRLRINFIVRNRSVGICSDAAAAAALQVTNALQDLTVGNAACLRGDLLDEG